MSIVECYTELCQGRKIHFGVLIPRSEGVVTGPLSGHLPCLQFSQPLRLHSASHCSEHSVLAGTLPQLFFHDTTLSGPSYLLTMLSLSWNGLFIQATCLNVSSVCPSSLQLLCANISQPSSVIFHIETRLNSRPFSNCPLDISPRHCITSHTWHVHNHIYQSP